VKRSIIAGLAAATVLAIGAPSASAATSISISSFPQVSAEDRIDMTYRDFAVPSDQIGICLRTADWMTWRKGIEAFGRRKTTPWFGGGPVYSYQNVGGVFLQDHDHGARCMTISRTDAVNDTYYAPYEYQRTGKLTFGKAKTFGIYTQMYDLQWTRSTAVGGRQYTFTWVDD